MIGVLGLQGAIREHRRALARVGADSRVVRRPHELEGLDGLVIPGGESTTMSRLALDLGVMEPVREAISSGLPAFGTCAGLIMLARDVLDGRSDQQQFGGLDIVVRRNAFGRQIDSFEAGVDVLDWSPGFPGVFIRAPHVVEHGPDVQVIGRLRPHPARRLDQVDEPGARASSTRPGAASRGRQIVAVRQGAVIATAFHPELTADVRLHEVFIDMVKEQ